MPSTWLLWDRVRALARANRLYQSERIFQDQSQLDRVTAGGEFLDWRYQATILDQTNLLINRLQRYKDYEQMDQVGEISLALDLYSDEACLTGDTRIPLLDGTNPTIAELAERGLDAEFLVYAFDLKTNQYVPAKAKGARITGKNVPVVKVTLDDGSAIRCTSDHLFMLNDGRYLRASELQPGTSLKPLYKKRRFRGKKGKFLYDKPPYPTASGYDFLFDGKHFTTVHGWIYYFFNDEKVEVIHHNDYNSLNNYPNNLIGMTNKEHNEIHCRYGSSNPSFNPISIEDIKRIIKDWRGPLTQEKLCKACNIGERVLNRVLNEADLKWIDFRDTYHQCAKCGCRLINAGLNSVCKKCRKQYQHCYHQNNKNDEDYRQKRLISKRKSYGAVKQRQCQACLTIKPSSEFQKNLCAFSPYCNDCRPNNCQNRYLQKSFANHKVLKVELAGIAEAVYDIEVPDCHCFAAGTESSWVIVHNSLVDPERKHTITIRARSKRLKKELEEFYFGTLQIDNNLRPMMRYLCKFGDNPYEVIPNKNRDGVAAIKHMNVYNFTRIETRFGDLVGFYFQDDLLPEPMFLHPWQVVHLRLTDLETIYRPYGKSILDGSRKAFKQLRLLEDGALIYRITRSPERRIFKIPVGMIPAKEVPEYLEAIARRLKRQRFYNPTTGTFDERYSPLTYEDDFFLPVKCISISERIPLLDGRTRTLRELIDEYGIQRDRFWVYSFDKDVNRFVPKKARCVAGPKQSKIVRITLDDGSCHDSTPDHLFYLKDGNQVQAQNLAPGDSLLVCYRKISNLNSNKKGDYEHVLQPSGAWEPTHRLYWGGKAVKGKAIHHKDFNSLNNILENLDLMGFREHFMMHSRLGTGVMRKRKLDPVLDAKLRQCSRDNLERMRRDPKWAEARSRAARKNKRKGVLNGIGKLNGTELGKYYASRGAKTAWEAGVYSNTICGKNNCFYVDLDEYVEIVREILTRHKGRIRALVREWNANPDLVKVWKATRTTITDKITEWGYQSIADFCDLENVEKINQHTLAVKLQPYAKHMVDLVSKNGFAKAARLWNSDSKLASVWHARANKIRELAKAYGWKQQTDKVQDEPGLMSPDELVNKLRQCGSVGKFLQTNKSKLSHNTILKTLNAAGYNSVRELLDQPTNHTVVKVEFLGELQDTFCLEVEDTHNFMLASGVIVHNSDGTGPDITTLPGAQNLDQIEDILYFKKKMVAPLKIPFARVGIGEGAGEDFEKSLSSSHAEFAKAVQWVQREAASGLTKLGIIHLALRGFSVDDLKGFQITLSASSAIEELYRIETWKTRTDVMSDLKDLGWFPKEWIVTHFTDLTPDEIQELKEMEETAAGGGPGGGKPGLGLGGLGDLGGEEEGGLGELGGEGEEGGLGELGGEGEEGGEEGGLGETSDLDTEKRLLLEWQKQKYDRRMKCLIERWAGRRGHTNAESPGILNNFKYLLEQKELDGLSNGDDNVLITCAVDHEERQSAIAEVHRVLVEATGDQLVESVPEDITPEDLP